MPLVVSRVNHCDLRDLEWPAVVGGDEGHDLGSQLVTRIGFAVSEHPAFEDGEEELDLVQPAGVGGGEVQHDPALVSVEELVDLVGGVGGEVVDDAVEFVSFRGDRDQVGEELDEVVRAGRVGDPTFDVALMDVEAGEEGDGAGTGGLELSGGAGGPPSRSCARGRGAPLCRGGPRGGGAGGGGGGGWDPQPRGSPSRG